MVSKESGEDKRSDGGAAGAAFRSGGHAGAGRNGRHIRLAGDWHAIWQTTVDGAPNINTEVVRVTQTGARLTLVNHAVSPENPIGGYRWRGRVTLRDNHFLIGSYAAIEAHASSHGSLFFVVNRSGDYLTGKWVGCNLDSNFTWGFGVLARDKERGTDKLYALLGLGRGDYAGAPESAQQSDGTTPEIVASQGGLYG